MYYWDVYERIYFVYVRNVMWLDKINKRKEWCLYEKFLIKLVASVMTVVALGFTPSEVYANTESFASSEMISNETMIEIERLINEVDNDQLFQDALNEVIDTQVPLEISQNITASVEFTPVNGEEKIAFDVYKTVQKVGEVTNSEGEISSLYVAAAVATDTKMDNGYNKKYGVEAYTYLYWIDNLGTNNELYAAQASWDTHGYGVSDRSVQYGVMDSLGLTFTADSNKVFINTNSYYNEVSGTYYGFVLGCKSSIYVTNLGTVTCSVHSGILT